MSKSLKLISIALVAFSGVWPLFGHHGSGASYDQTRLVKFEGTVVEFLWRNPHSALFIKGTDESGKLVDYSIEMNSPGLMVKAGLTRNSFKPGDHAVLEVHPSFLNPAAGECQGCKIIVNGKEIGKPAGGAEAER